MLFDSFRPDDTPAPAGVPDELSMQALLDDIYATADELTDFELEELSVRDAERRLSDEILASLRVARNLSDVLAELGFPVRVAV